MAAGGIATGSYNAALPACVSTGTMRGALSTDDDPALPSFGEHELDIELKNQTRRIVFEIDLLCRFVFDHISCWYSGTWC